MGPKASTPQTTLTVALSDSVDPVITAVNYNYSCVVTNTGLNTATLVTATVTLHASLSFVSGSGTGWTVGAIGQIVTCTRASLAVGAAPTITITVTSGGSATTATSTADASASNAPSATQSSQGTVVKLVTIDATSGIRSPSSTTEWSDFNAYHVAIGTPNFPNVMPSLLWLCQDASGNLADAIDGFTGTVAGTPISYQQSITGWSRFGISGGDGGTANADNQSASLPDPAAASMTMIGWATATATPAAIRNFHVIGTANLTTNRINTTPRFQGVSGGNVVTGTTAITGAVRPLVNLYDVTSGRVMCASDLEKLTPTKAATTGKRHRLSFSFPGAWLYAFSLFGAAAELSDAGVKSLLTAMGWSIAWT